MFIQIMKMLYYDRIDVSERIDLIKQVHHYWYFLNYCFTSMSAIDVMILLYCNITT